MTPRIGGRSRADRLHAQYSALGSGVREQVVTSFSRAGADAYGRRCVQSWDAAAPLVIYLDEPMHLPVETRLTSEIPLWLQTRSQLPNQNEAASRPEYYRWQARRFAVKPFVWLDAAEKLGSGVLTWLDGDTVTRRRIPDGFFVGLLEGADVAYLGRGPMHPETGYVGFRIPAALPLLRWCRDAYLTGAFRGLDGWTDCHVLRAALRAVPVRATDLTSDRYVGNSHIWPVSPLAPYLTHFKGRKKGVLIAC